MSMSTSHDHCAIGTAPAQSQAKGTKEGAYKPQDFEAAWQQRWEDEGLYQTYEVDGKPKFYCLDYFPYPSGDGLHVGHCRNYIPTDLISRFKRMKGYSVLHPMGWDAFGEPAEQFAIAHGVHPRATTDQSTANFRRQMRLIGTSYDWKREIDSSDPDYYRWTQWFFLLLYKRGLAYRDANWQWWCSTCQTTLSNHEVTDGVCWRGHSNVAKRKIPAWYFKITAYADQLLSDLELIDWPDRIKTLQRNWIGRSEGYEIDFVSETGEQLPIFTTRPDTLYGVTFLAIAPEHPLVKNLLTPETSAQVEEYITEARRKSEIDRATTSREKTGVFTGTHVLHPLTQEKIPVWVADYVLPTYGTGAVMGVPAHDQRDFEFAQHYHLPIRAVITAERSTEPDLSAAYTNDGYLIHSGPFTGQPNREAITAINAALEKAGSGRSTINYQMRDWLISRQRYWGAPIPIIHCPSCGQVPVPEDQLPVRLPEMDHFQPDGSGRSPLARVPEFLNTTCPRCGQAAQRETDTMGGFACSSWYFLRFTSPQSHQHPFDPASVRYWMPVDLYMGGAEHAVLHLLYTRFWTKVMADAGLVAFREPFSSLANQGTLHAPDGLRMSKSRGNVITPDSVVQKYGADTLRVYILFMAPYDQDVSWNTEGIAGSRRFLERVWDLFGKTYTESSTSIEQDQELERLRHKTICEVSEALEHLKFNIMVAILMTFVNTLQKRYTTNAWQTRSFHQALETLMVLLAPSAPHITEELWRLSGHTDSIHQQPWPQWDQELLGEIHATIAIQVNGRLRDTIEVAADATKEEVQGQALASTRIQQFLQNKTISGIYYVPGKVFNIVTGKD